jgi:hypothetical protein
VVRNIFKGKPTPKTVLPVQEVTNAVPVAQPSPPTLLQKERENLTEAMAKLHEIQLAAHNQNKVIAHIRENISLLENNPWFETLYVELRSREELPHIAVSPDFMESLKRAREAGLLTDPIQPKPETAL